MIFQIDSLSDYKAVFDFLIEKNAKVFLLSGELGAGKTTFIREYLSYISSQDEVESQNFMSPTFSIINQYTINEELYSHIDLYRLSEEEIYDLDLVDIHNQSRAVFIEWFENSLAISKEITKNHITIKIEKGEKEEQRRIEIK